MPKKKELLAAGVVRDLRFATVEDMELYLYKLQHRKQLYAVLETCERPDRSVLIRIVQQYNNAPLIELYSY